MGLTPDSITAVLVGLDSRAATFQVQSYVNNFRAEPLLAILPGVAPPLWLRILNTVQVPTTLTPGG